jgi:hypothetical protein
MSLRRFPVIAPESPERLEPISFVTVHFCDEYHHNIVTSACVQDPANQLITIDNRQGHRYAALSAALNDGLDRARHDLVAVVHEDVVLPDNWQARLQRVLDRLQQTDPDWGLAGSVGWDGAGRAVGHWSDPREYTNTLEGRDFAPVERLDEQILIFRKSRGLRFDPDLPSIHNIGRDLASTLQAAGRQTYALDAPTIHKYADETGVPITAAEQSSKIQTRDLPANLAERRDSDEYLHAKWPEWAGRGIGGGTGLDGSGDIPAPPRPPVIALARGGGGSRLLSLMLQDLGIFLGDKVSGSGDSMDMVDAVYRAVLSRYQHRAPWQRDRIVARLRAAARAMLAGQPADAPWGFKLPEAMLILPELDRAFPGARYVHMIRDPLATCLRRTHMTARFDNAIGRTAIRAAYAHAGLPAVQSLSDSPALHMARTTRHQLEIVRAQGRAGLDGRYLELRFEDLLAAPGRSTRGLGDWLERVPGGQRLAAAVDTDRAAQPDTTYDAATEAATAAVLHDLRSDLGYVAPATPPAPDTAADSPGRPGRRAIIFLAWGDKHIAEMQRCIAESPGLPDYPIFLITDHDTRVDDLGGRITVRRVTFKLMGLKGHARCGELWDHIPPEFDTYLYLDVDTRVLGDVSLGFDKAEQYGMALAQAAHYSLEHFKKYSEVMLAEGVEPRGQLIYGAGVIFFTRQPRCEKVMKTYRRLCATYSDTPEARWGDQPHLSLAMELNDLNPYTLTTGFNHRAFGEWISGEVRVWHSYTPVPGNVNVLQPVFPRCYSPEAKEVVNAWRLKLGD